MLHIGFREVGRKLGIADTMTTKLMRGENVNFDTIIKFTLLNKKSHGLFGMNQNYRKIKKLLKLRSKPYFSNFLGSLIYGSDLFLQEDTP